jgi:hypothetical protein
MVKKRMERITANTQDGASVEFDVDLGDSLEDAVAKFSAEIVWSHAHRALTVAAQGTARGLIRQGKSTSEIQEKMNEWRPGMPRQTRSNEEKIRDMLDKMTPEQRSAMIKELKAAKAAA